jgi:anion-transporting  ArsA/GET3 family ATPase
MSSLLDRRLILVAGKGGVGRSTVAAALGAACARRGRRTLLYEANANDRWGSFFHGDAVGTQVTRLRDNLHAVNTNPAAALEEYGLMVLRFKRVYKMVFENRVTRYFLRAIPGLDDYSILGKAWYHTTEERRGKPGLGHGHLRPAGQRSQPHHAAAAQGHPRHRARGAAHP